jgi:hypothetical protein
MGVSANLKSLVPVDFFFNNFWFLFLYMEGKEKNYLENKVSLVSPNRRKLIPIGGTTKE